MKNLILSVLILVLSITTTQAQEHNNKPKTIGIDIKEGTNPDIYVDGKKFDFDMELINEDMIEYASIIKGEKAIKEYNAPNGVIIIKTKNTSKSKKSKFTIKNTDGSLNALVLIDGIKSDKKTLDTLSPNNIKHIEVIKGEKAIEKYNAPNGAVIITTKKKRKRI